MADNQLALDSVIDVRSVMPRERHPLIFNTFEQLEPGHGFGLVDDHDAKPLYYQLQAERQGAFGWDYLEKGARLLACGHQSHRMSRSDPAAAAALRRTGHASWHRRKENRSRAYERGGGPIGQARDR